jgi:hypothetical protein
MEGTVGAAGNYLKKKKTKRKKLPSMRLKILYVKKAGILKFLQA